MDWHECVDGLLDELIDGQITWQELYISVGKLFPDTLESAIRGYVRRTSKYKAAHTPTGKPVGVVGDLHIPFDHPNYLSFLRDTFKRYGVGQVVFIGDIFDHYSYSRFVKKPIAMNPVQEKDVAKERVKKYCKAFPRAKVILGNHDTRYIDRAEENGIDAGLIKGFKEIYDLPKSWEIYDEYENLLVMDNVLYIHGSAYNGQSGARQAALNEQMSVVMGHGHSFAGVFPIANRQKLMFGMNVGAGIDIGAYSFAYNRKDRFRPLLGCGIVFNSSYAIWVPMGKEYFRG